MSATPAFTPRAPRALRRVVASVTLGALVVGCTSESSPSSKPVAILADPAANRPDRSAPVPAPDEPPERLEAIGAPADGGVTPEGGVSCGVSPLPDCPLQGWMKHPLSDLLAANDFESVASALEALSTFAPPSPSYPNWRSICFDGASAARVFELEPVRAACRGCHTQYLAKYKAEFRLLPLPAVAPTAR